jgi:hypothetical protein
MLFAQVHFFGAILMQVVLKQTNNLRALLERIVELLVPCPYYPEDQEGDDFSAVA